MWVCVGVHACLLLCASVSSATVRGIDQFTSHAVSPCPPRTLNCRHISDLSHCMIDGRLSRWDISHKSIGGQHRYRRMTENCQYMKPCELVSMFTVFTRRQRGRKQHSLLPSVYCTTLFIRRTYDKLNVIAISSQFVSDKIGADCMRESEAGSRSDQNARVGEQQSTKSLSSKCKIAYQHQPFTSIIM